MSKFFALFVVLLGVTQAKAAGLVEDLGVNLFTQLHGELSALQCGYRRLGAKDFLRNGLAWRVQRYTLALLGEGRYSLHLEVIGNRLFTGSPGLEGVPRELPFSVENGRPLTIHDRFDQFSDEQFECRDNRWRRTALSGQVYARRGIEYVISKPTYTDDRKYSQRALAQLENAGPHAYVGGEMFVRVLDEAKNYVRGFRTDLLSEQTRDFSYTNDDGKRIRERRAYSQLFGMEVPDCRIILGGAGYVLCDEKHASYQMRQGATAGFWGQAIYSLLEGNGYGLWVTDQYTGDVSSNVVHEVATDGGPFRARGARRRNETFVAAQIRVNGMPVDHPFTFSEYQGVNRLITRYRDRLRHFFSPPEATEYDVIEGSLNAAFDAHYALNNTCCEINNIWW